jgi:hypothetical protein
MYIQEKQAKGTSCFFQKGLLSNSAAILGTRASLSLSMQALAQQNLHCMSDSVY